MPRLRFDTISQRDDRRQARPARERAIMERRSERAAGRPRGPARYPIYDFTQESSTYFSLERGNHVHGGAVGALA